MPQTGYWTTNLIDARLTAGDVDITFPISDRTVNGRRAWARRRYPFRNGQSDEDTGLDPREIGYTVPLYRDVNEEHYPNTFHDIIELFESDEARGRATLTDPEFGPLPVRLVDYGWHTNAEKRDGGELRLTFETLGHDAFTILTSRGAGGDAVSASEDAARVDDALANAGQAPTDTARKMASQGVPLTGTELRDLGLSVTFAANIGLSVGVDIDAEIVAGGVTSVSASTGFQPVAATDEVRLVSGLVSRFQERVQQGVLESADEIASELDVLLGRLGAARDVDGSASAVWPVLAATSRLMTTVRRVAEHAFHAAPLVVDHEVGSPLSAVEIAVQLYGDPFRVQDVIDLNPSVSPDFLLAGTVLTVPME